MVLRRRPQNQPFNPLIVLNSIQRHTRTQTVPNNKDIVTFDFRSRRQKIQNTLYILLLSYPIVKATSAFSNSPKIKNDRDKPSLTGLFSQHRINLQSMKATRVHEMAYHQSRRRKTVRNMDLTVKLSISTLHPDFFNSQTYSIHWKRFRLLRQIRYQLQGERLLRIQMFLEELCDLRVAYYFVFEFQNIVSFVFENQQLNVNAVDFEVFSCFSGFDFQDSGVVLA